MKITSRKWLAPLRIVRSLKRDRQGSALVEGAILVPVLIVLMFGVFEFSWFFYQQHVISTGIRDAARYLARSPDPCDPGSPVWGVALANAKNLAASGSIEGGPARVKGWSAATVVARCSEVDNSPPARGQSRYRGGSIVYVVTVSTKFTDPSLGLFGVLGLPKPTISILHSERVIGPS
jgi:Flp pilus assembly protein TadG